MASTCSDSGSQEMTGPTAGHVAPTLSELSSQTDADAQEEDDVDASFYFESDHLALKGNKDYQNMLRTVALLEAQRIRAIQDLDRLVDHERAALADPIAFVRKLQAGEETGIPKPIKVAPLPLINWEKYSVGMDPAALAKTKHMTRNKRSSQGNGDSSGSRQPTPAGTPPLSESEGQSSHLVRGRLKMGTKPATFNQLWTAEEQKRLEELLVTFPPEEVEARRWEKIAQALGNRTLQQVASRVQKYFIKLARAGLPVPGRLPSIAGTQKKTSMHRHQRHNRFYFQSSTFMTSYDPPVYMSDDDDDGSSQAGSSEMSMPRLPPSREPGADVEISDEEDVPLEMRDTSEYQELMRLKQLRQCRLQDDGVHVGYKCDSCGLEPIVGTRWHCVECPPEDSVDFCDLCADSTMETTTHQSSHQIEAIQLSSRGSMTYDSDYTRFTEAGFSYLDPNFMPAT